MILFSFAGSVFRKLLEVGRKPELTVHMQLAPEDENIWREINEVKKKFPSNHVRTLEIDPTSGKIVIQTQGSALERIKNIRHWEDFRHRYFKNSDK